MSNTVYPFKGFNGSLAANPAPDDTKAETLRLIATMSLGSGALAVIGGTIVVVGLLTLSAGALAAVRGYNSLNGIGVQALTGFISACMNVRIIAPVTAGIGLAATIGAGATRNWARCGSTRRSTCLKSWVSARSPIWRPRG
jgi:ABC-type transporter Mla maintaining outer membrane lipid asymmetry permease subunit MlaE